MMRPYMRDGLTFQGGFQTRPYDIVVHGVVKTNWYESPGVVSVQRYGKPVLAIMTWDDYEGLMETLDGSPQSRRSRLRSSAPASDLRRAVTERSHPEYTVLDGVKGHGQFVGTFLAWTQLSDGWFGEGEIKFYMDGDRRFPTICGTGTEDYFCGSYGFPEVYTTAYAGNTLAHPGTSGPPKWSLYRWHILDPIRFQEDLRVTIQALGWWPGPKGRFQPLADDIASVAYWYQAEPHAEFPALPSLEERYPR